MHSNSEEDTHGAYNQMVHLANNTDSYKNDMKANKSIITN